MLLSTGLESDATERLKNDSIALDPALFSL